MLFASSSGTLLTREVREKFGFGREPVLTELLAHGGHFADLPHNSIYQWISNMGIVDGQLHVQVLHDTSVHGLSVPSFYLLRYVDSDVEHDTSHDNLNEMPLAGFLILPNNETRDDIEHRNMESFAPLIITTRSDDKYELLENQVFELPDNQTLPTWVDSRYKYFNFVFDIDIDVNELENYTLVFWGSKETFISGNWQITATTDAVGERMRIWASDIEVYGLNFNTFILTPLGLQVIGGIEAAEIEDWQGLNRHRLWWERNELSLIIETTSGNIDLWQPLGSFSFYPDASFNLTWRADSIIDVPSVTAVIIDGMRIEIE
jgi:hypothetical protein